MNPQSNSVVFKLSFESVYQFAFIIMLSIIPFSLLKTGGLSISIIRLIGAIIPGLIVIYFGVTFLFKRRIDLRDDQFIFYYGPFRYKLDPDKMRIYYEKILIFSSGRDKYGLVLYRDIDKVIGITFNNKFLLECEMDEVKLKYYREQLKNKLGLEVNVVDELW
jgi:hypothetical protein